MSELYLPVRFLHMGSAAVSISLFLLRGCLMLADSPLPSKGLLRFLPHVVDTVLLLSAMGLTAMIYQYPFVHGWLTAKVLLLFAYIVLGSIALKRGQSKGIRTLAFLAASIVVAFLISVARTHDPLGVLASRF